MIEDFDGFYEVSNLGNVRSYHNNKHGRKKEPHLLRVDKNNKGYYYVGLCNGQRNKKLVHVLVAKAFVENPNNLPFVDHIDRTPTNNHVSNLRWVTHSQNMRNTGMRKTNTSGHKHVSWSDYDKAFKIQMVVDGKRYTTKRKNLEDALKKRDEILSSLESL